MYKKEFHVLLIDSFKYSDEFERIISEIKNYRIQIYICKSINASIKVLQEKNLDVVFVGINEIMHKDFNEQIQLFNRYIQIPFVFITNQYDESTAINLIQKGAQDYIDKKDIDAKSIVQTIRYSYYRKLNENELRESTERLYNIAENIHDGLLIIKNNDLVFINSRMEEVTGFSFNELREMYSDKWDSENQLGLFLRKLNNTGNYFSDESIWIKVKSGRRSFFRIRSNVKKENGSKLTKYISITDITEQWQSEIAKEFVNKISELGILIDSEKVFFKTIYKELKKIFNDKDICLGIIHNENIKLLCVENKEIKSHNYSLKNSLCNYLLQKTDASYYNEKELVQLQRENKIEIVGKSPKSWMGSSLFSKDKKHGILILKDFKNENAFNDDDLKLLRFISRQITFAIQKSKDEEKIHQLSLAVEQSPVCITITDIDGNIEYVNDRFIELTGYSRDEVIGKNSRFLQSGQTTEKSYKTLWKSITSGEPWKGIFINRKKNGEIYYEDAKISPIINRDGKTTHYVAIKEEITDQIIKEKELLKAKEKAEGSENRVKNLLLEMQLKNNEMSFLLDGAKKILEISTFEDTAKGLHQSCKELVGASTGFVAVFSETKKESSILFSDDDMEQFMNKQELIKPLKNLLAQMLDHKSIVIENNFTNTAVEKKGTNDQSKLKNALFAPIIINGYVSGLLGFINKTHNFSDADEKIASAFSELASLALFNTRNIDALKVAKQNAEESDQLKSSFLANMSHEVRTPMNGIMGFSQFLKDPDLTYENKLRYIKIINDSCEQLLSIIEDILEISKLQTGQIEIVNEEFEASQVVNTIYINFVDLCLQKGINLECIIENNQNKKILFTDKSKLTQVLSNLLSNAIKFTNEGKIQIGVSASDKSIEFFVKDTGIGIESEIREKIFERFRQAETTMSRTYGGTGLGLAIAKGYIELMDGEIWVDSQVGEGSIFKFRLPLRNYTNNADYIPMDLNSGPMISFNRSTILIAEDEEINYQYIKRVFNGLGINNIIRAQNGQDAINKYNENRNIDLIMMDLKMPVVDGFQATKHIKSINPKIPIIAQTALAIPGDKQKAMDAGCDDYISKPIDYDTLLNLMEKYISFK